MVSRFVLLIRANRWEISRLSIGISQGFLFELFFFASFFSDRLRALANEIGVLTETRAKEVCVGTHGKRRERGGNQEAKDERKSAHVRNRDAFTASCWQAER